MRPRFLIAACLGLAAGPAAAQPVTPPVTPPVDDPVEELDEATPEGDPPATGPEAPIEEALEGAGESESEVPDLAPTEAAEAATESDIEVDDARRERRRRSHQAAIERAEPRPALPELEEEEPPPWARRLEIGGDFAFVIRPLASAKVDPGIGYQPAPGWGVHLHWNIVSWFRFTPYFIDSHHALDIPPGALVTASPQSITPNATIETATVTTFSFGAKLQPTWNITDELRTWATVGVGWGRFEFPTMTITEGDQVFEARDRSAVFVEFPLGLGISYDIINRWVALEYEATVAPITGQSGNAHETFQAVDADGALREVGPFGGIELSIVQTLGLSLIF